MPLNPKPLFDNLHVVYEQATELRRQVRAEAPDADLERHLNALCLAIDTAAHLVLDVYSECLRANLTAREPTPGPPIGHRQIVDE